MDDIERQEEFCKLKQLYQENLEFITVIKDNEELNTLAYKQFRETLTLLKKYIVELENGAEITTNWKEWSNRLAQVIDKLYNDIKPRGGYLNDDNFYIMEDGEEW